MSFTYEGVYRHQIDAYNHEGYPAEFYRAEQDDSGGVHNVPRWRAACECGWVGEGVYEQTEPGEDGVQREWWWQHMRDRVVAEAQRQPGIEAVAVLGVLWDLQEQAAHITTTGNPENSARYFGICDGIRAVEQLLDTYATTHLEQAQAAVRASLDQP